MCVIIDANHVHKIFLTSNPNSDHLNYLKNQITSNKIQFVFGGKLRSEYSLCTRFLPLLAEFKRSGTAVSFGDSEVSKVEQNLPAAQIQSDDSHILALAIVSGARILVTDDGYLMADFKNIEIVQPKGKIYPKKGYQKILRKCR